MNEHSERARQITLTRELGRGGMGTVHEALVGGRRVALKRPRADVLRRRPAVRSLFEREFYTLAQLAHPNIIEVYDFGVDDDGPYYTMELLEGGELASLVPMEWRKACEVLRDVAAALAMMHSRRMVHRDVTLRNVRLTASGAAKLMDFGAMTPIGIPEQTIGTPAYMAPEAVYRQAVDQRTDLFSLGALGYRLLSGRDAFVARSVEHLRDAWRSRPVSLSSRNPEIPSALDELIRKLLNLNPDSRCRTAAEVLAQLSSLVSGPEAGDAEIARAYLATPALIGRDDELATIRRHILQTARLRGSTVVVEGASGTGRSRLLDSCVLDGQLAGALVLRAQGLGSAHAPLALIAQLGAQLVEARPDLVPNDVRILDLLLHGGVSESEAAANSRDEVALQQDIVDWLVYACRKPVLFVIDDMHLADLASAAVLARLADVAPKYPLVLIVSTLQNSVAVCAQALRVIRDRATILQLTQLTEGQTLSLVRSLFDDTVNVQLAAKRIYEIAQGNPQATIDLAEWLVEGGHVVYERGRWLLPDTLSGLPLPAHVDDALRQRLAQLSDNALKLGAAIASAGDADILAADCPKLLDETDSPFAHAALAELLGANVLTPNGRGYNLTQTAFRGLLLERIEPAVRAAIHRRIANICLASDQLDWAIFHLFYGAREEQALALLLARLSKGLAPVQILHSLEERVAFLREVLQFCRSHGRPAAELFAVQNELVRSAEVKVSLVREEIEQLGALYKELSGYTDWLELPKDMEPVARIGAAMQRSAARFQALPKADQVMSPREALPRMVDFVGACLASAAANSELSLVAQLPPLTPFAPISDGVRLMERYMHAAEATIGGRADVASAAFIEVLAELDGEAGQKMGAGADRLRRHAIIAIGMLNAGLSRSIALDYADRLEALAIGARDAYAKSCALRVRHQYHLRRGNWMQAQHWQHEVELDKLSDRSAVFNPSGIYALSWIYATVGSVAGMRDCLMQMREYSTVSEGLRIWERYMMAEYDRLRGAHEQALDEYQSVLADEAGKHMAWLYAAHGSLLCFEALGRFEEGRAFGQQLLARAAQAKLNVVRGLILRPLALLEARLGNFDQAVAYLSENIEQAKRFGMGGVNLGVAYEFRARVALYAKDEVAFKTYFDLCGEHYLGGGGNPDLTARYDALLDQARVAGLIDKSWQARERAPRLLSHAQVELRDRLADCAAPARRYMQALLAIVNSANAAGGYLFGVTSAGLELLAGEGPEAISPELLDSARRYLNANIGHSSESQIASGVDSTFTGSALGDDSWRNEATRDLLPHVVATYEERSIVGVILLRAGTSVPRAPSTELLEVVAQALISAGDVRAAA